MHYRNGKEAKNGDKVVQLETSSGKILATGQLQNAVAGNDHCNGELVITGYGPQGPAIIIGACLCDCLLVDDVASILGETIKLWHSALLNGTFKTNRSWRKNMATKKTSKRTIKTARRSSAELISSAWLGRLAERIERHADDIDPRKDPPLRASYERADDLRRIAGALRGRMKAA